MIKLTREEEEMLWPEYEKYLVNNERHRLYDTKIEWPMSFDTWWRFMTDNEKDKREGK